MAKITISTHSITIKKKNTPNKDSKFEILDKIGISEEANGVDLFSIFEESMKQSKKIVNDEKHQKVWGFDSVESDSQKRIITGIIRSGEYGYGTELYHVINEEKRLRDPQEAELMPYYFLIYLPPDNDMGYIILQRFQNFGIKNIFLKELDSFVSSRLSEYKLDMDNLITEQLFNEIISKSEVKEIRVSKKIMMPISTDEADVLDPEKKETKKTEHTDYIYETSFKTYQQGGKISRIGNSLFQKFLKKEDILQSLVTELGIPKDSDEISVVVDDERMSRTITLYDRKLKLEFSKQLFPYFDITDKVDKNNVGHPEFKSIDNIAKDYLNMLIGKERTI